METVKVSPQFHVVFSRKIRESLGIRPGQRLQVLVYDGRVELIPLRRMKEMRGFLRGIDTKVERDEDRLGTSSIHRDGSSISRTARTRISSHLPWKIWKSFWSPRFRCWKFSSGFSNSAARMKPLKR
jgi:AbrB family looped-hinge helix DNA binding protein